MCCYDGAYLKPGEEAALAATVRAHRGFFAAVPEPFVVDGVWLGRLAGRKTAVRPHAYRSADFPAHFGRTRCVFALADGRCSLQVLAVALGEHPWARKPEACWRHPLRAGPAGLEPPPATPEGDPDRAPGYPGFATYTACGRDRPDGIDWREACAAELAYDAARRGAPAPPGRVS
jgi:hypothetical protein